MTIPLHKFLQDLAVLIDIQKTSNLLDIDSSLFTSKTEICILQIEHDLVVELLPQ